MNKSEWQTKTIPSKRDGKEGGEKRRVQYHAPCKQALHQAKAGVIQHFPPANKIVVRVEEGGGFA